MTPDTAVDEDDDLQPQRSLPPFLLLEPAHLRLYGTDASSSRNLHRRRSPAAVHRTRETGDPIRNSGDGGYKRSYASGSGPKHPPWSGVGGGRETRKAVLPFAPPAMSARCQLHPSAVQALGVSPGDPVLAFFLVEGGAQLLSLISYTPPSMLLAGGDGGDTSPPHIHRGIVASDQETEKRKAGEICIPASGLNLPVDSRAGGSIGVCVSGGGTQGQRCVDESTEGVEAFGAGGAVGFLDSGKIVDMARCFLCTVWSNPHLTQEEVAIDGRVNVPLNVAELTSAGLSQSMDRGIAPEGKKKSSLRRDLSEAEYLLSAYLKATIDRYSECEGNFIADPIVGVFPFHNAMNGQGIGNIRSGGAATGSVPLGTRVTARMPSVFSTMAGPSKRATSSGLPPEYTSLIKRSIRHLVVSDGCEVVVPVLPNPNAFLDDEGATAASGGVQGSSTSSHGNIIEHHDGTAFARIGPFSTNSKRSATSGVGLSASPSQASPVGRQLHAGQHVDKKRGGPLSALLRGAVCVIIPDTLLLVEAGMTDAPEHRGGIRKNPSERVDGIESGDGEGREGPEISDHEESDLRGDMRSVGRMSPKDALVELMLLPMGASHPSDGSTALELLIPRGVLLTGPPGVGKTYAVKSAVEAVRKLTPREVAGSYQVRLTSLNGAEVLSMGEWEACRALREAFASAEDWTKQGFRNLRRRCAVIFLDEADGLLARRDRDGDKAGGGEAARPLAQLLTLMDGFHKTEGAHVIVIGATNRPGALDPALRRPGRFDRELALAPPDVGGRVDILWHHLRKVQVIGGEETILEAATKCVGYVGADLAALAREAALVAIGRTGDIAKTVIGPQEEALTWPGDGSGRAPRAKVWPQDLAAAMEKVGASSLRGHQVTVPDTPWSDIGGMEEAKAKLRQAIEWPVAHRDAFSRMGLTPPRGILLFGPPGCSKTTLVRAAATAAGATFVSLSGADVFSPYLGEAEATVRQAFLLARNAAPALLFFDEIDAIVCKRDTGSSNSAESRVLATFLTEMDGVGSLRGDGVIVVGATNRPEAVDKALLRPGRFDQVVYAALPDADARRQIFEVHTRKMALDRKEVDFEKLAVVSKGLTGAEIEGVCREAAMSALREACLGNSAHLTHDDIEYITVKMRHLMVSARASAARPGVTADMIAGYERFAAGL